MERECVEDVSESMSFKHSSLANPVMERYTV